MVLTIGLSCVGAVLFLLFAPLHVHVALERETALETRVRLSWLFGLVRVRVHPRAPRERPPKEERAPKERARRRFARRVAGALRRPDLRTRLIQFVRDVLRAIRPRDVRLHARIGMEDPADTGRLWGLVGPLGVWLSESDVRLEPEFDAACLSLRAAARVRLIPGQLLLMTLAFLLSPAVLRAVVAR